jgi:hypothetical protein
MTNQRSMIVDVVNCVALTGRSELPWKAVPSARRPSRAARATHLPTRPARKGRLGCNRVLVNEPDPFFSYDPNGNRATANVNGAAYSYSYDASSNRLSSLRGPLSATYGYAAQGNTTTVNGSGTYNYNSFNRLASSGGASNYISPQPGSALAQGGRIDRRHLFCSQCRR